MDQVTSLLTPFHQRLFCDRMKVFSYQRFSSEKQKEGDSARRQIEGARHWAVKNGHELDETVSFLDENKSGWKGEHLTEGGKLHLFLRMVDDGKIPKDSILVVESFDRLSRLPITEASELFNSILRRGLTVVFLQPERVVSKAIVETQPFLLIEVLITGIRSNEESATKSKRIKAAVERRKEQTKHGRRLQVLCPPWCDLVNKEYVPDKKKVAAIERMFTLYLEGQGAYVIARTLNEEKVPTFGRGSTTSTKGLSDQWYKTYITRLMKDKRLIGHCSFNSSTDYFPKVIEENVFYRAQARITKPAAKGRRNHPSAHSNLFKGLCRCSRCGGSVTRADKIRFGYLHEYLVCEAGRTGKDCKYVSFNYRWLESSFFTLIDSPAFYASQADNPPNGEHEVIQGQLAVATKQRDKYAELIAADEGIPSKTLVSELKKWELRVEELEVKADVAKGIDLERTNESTDFMELKNNMFHWLRDQERRNKISDYIRSRVDRIVVRYGESNYPAYTVYFRAGKVFTVTILSLGPRKDWHSQVREGLEIGYKEDSITYYHEAYPDGKPVVFVEV